MKVQTQIFKCTGLMLSDLANPYIYTPTTVGVILYIKIFPSLSSCTCTCTCTWLPQSRRQGKVKQLRLKTTPFFSEKKKSCLRRDSNPRRVHVHVHGYLPYSRLFFAELKFQEDHWLCIASIIRGYIFRAATRAAKIGHAQAVRAGLTPVCPCSARH